MPWNDQNGGGNRGPWSKGPSGGGGNQPPDLEEMIRRGQERLREMFPGGGGRGAGGGNNRMIFIIAGVAIVLFLIWSSVYRVDTSQQGIVLRFGDFARVSAPGLHVKLPYPIETVLIPTVTRINRLDIGMRESVGGATPMSIDEESLMLTGDENIVDINFSVFWRISDAPKFLFNVEGPERAVKSMAESAMREVVGKSKITVLQTTGRDAAQDQVRDIMQATLDAYGAGIQITEVKLQKVDPPAAVIDSFRDVQAARADNERVQNEAGVYANTIVPRARGEAAQITQAAEAYREQTVAEAQGEAQRFISVFDAYKNNKDVTRKRMYLETMEAVLGENAKILVDGKGGSGILPYLPLNELKPRTTTEVTSSAPEPVSTPTPSVSTQGARR